tara:strand:- start:210 stop:1076 length:867 start_codon:yes stop_codon:yes gene_type:complete
MSILINENTKVMVQGITGNQGSFHTNLMQQYGTNVISGVVPGKGGESVFGVPVFDTVIQAVEFDRPDCAVVFVPAAVAADAILEEVACGIPLIICITEGIPVLDVTRVMQAVNASGVRLIGPNCPGLISPGRSKVGIMPSHIHMPGPVGVVSRSGTLTYEVVQALTDAGIGQTTCVGIGGDPIIGTSFVEAVKMFQEDDETRGIVVIGEIGGEGEEQCAEYIGKYVDKPVVGFISGRSAPAEKRMGHAGAIVSGSTGSADAKISAFEEVGVSVARIPTDIAALISDLL